jgi:hypothetical protein
MVKGRKDIKFLSLLSNNFKCINIIIFIINLTYRSFDGEYRKFRNTKVNPALIVGEEMLSCFYEIAKWANLLAVVGFVVSGIMVVFAFIIGCNYRQ